MIGSITVVHFKNCRWNRQTRMFADNSYVYIGRYMGRFNLPNSPLANPFKLEPKDDTYERRIAILNRFESYARENQPMMNAIAELKRRVTEGENIKLVCWCKGTHGDKDVPCHGDVIKRLVMQYEKPETAKQEKLF